MGLVLYLDAAKHHYFDNETKVFLREMVLQSGEALESETRINALAFSHNYSHHPGANGGSKIKTLLN